MGKEETLAGLLMELRRGTIVLCVLSQLKQPRYGYDPVSYTHLDVYKRQAFKQVSAHAGYVADVITDVVCNYGRVARIIFRNASFYLTDQIGPHVSGFGVNTAANTAEQRDGTRDVYKRQKGACATIL